MIKKLILVAVCVLALWLTYVMVTSGLDLSNKLPIKIKIVPFTEITANGEVLSQKIDRIGVLNTTEIAAARNKVETEKANFEAKRTEYALLEANASEDEIAEANKKQEYLLDYLWIVIGNYANDNNVKFLMTIDDVNLRIKFDITGSYISIINFIYDIENDENLKFNLNGIEMASGALADSTKASFTVDGITVKTTTKDTAAAEA